MRLQNKTASGAAEEPLASGLSQSHLQEVHESEEESDLSGLGSHGQGPPRRGRRRRTHIGSGRLFSQVGEAFEATQRTSPLPKGCLCIAARLAVHAGCVHCYACMVG